MEEYIRNPFDDSWETVGSDDEAYQYWQKYWNKEAELGPLSRKDFLEYIPEDVFDDQALQLKSFPTLFSSTGEAIIREEYKLYEWLHFHHLCIEPHATLSTAIRAAMSESLEQYGG
ncbi:hypothetical protein Moror_5540 [Moniliophthora roreri MCA 2997]|uniref:Uncharacterized protein n=1 Tax=Moniliophthora roreri (strain MCA 2997) TaxID=1381753 RepID=V2WMY1_MONRO|nr:hypothetical protein Moror_5540 [Moniliophthora roreri MCA 2997]